MKTADQTYNKEHMARVTGNALGISFKQSIEVCNAIRNKDVAAAKKILNEAIAMKVPIRFKRFTEGAGHKRGMGPGKYPINTCTEILKLLDAVEANAQFKGLNTSGLRIEHISAKNAGNTWRYGRHRRRKMKRTHIEITVEETKKSDKKTAKKVEAKKADVKPSEKKEAAKQEVKKETKPAEKKPEAPKAEVKKEEAKPAPKVERENPKPTPKEVPTAAELAAKKVKKEAAK